MEIKRKYTDEPGADKGSIHLMINRRCGNSCPLCCNRQYDLETVPVARRVEGSTYRYAHWWRSVLCRKSHGYTRTAAL